VPTFPEHLVAFNETKDRFLNFKGQHTEVEQTRPIQIKMIKKNSLEIHGRTQCIISLLVMGKLWEVRNKQTTNTPG